MTLSDGTLRQYLKDGTIVIDPHDDHCVQAASIDFRLGRNFLIVEHNAMDIITLDEEIKYRSIESDTFVLPAHSFVLATTMEWIKLPSHITAFVEGRSSIGRMGLFIHNAGWIDPGFEGNVTLEMYNANSLPIKLQAGRRICQFVFSLLDKPAEHPYHGKYKGQRGTTGSRIFRDTEVREVK